MCITLRSLTSLTLLSALAATAGAQLDPAFPGLQIPVAPPADTFDSAIVVADVDLDGHDDLLSTSMTGSGAGAMEVLGVARGLPGGGFAATETWPIEPIHASNTGRLAVGDLDANGWPDVAVAGAHHVVVLYGTGAGHFDFVSSYFVTADWLYDIAVVNLDHDGMLDLVTASHASPAVGGEINVNLASNGGFLPTQVWPLDTPPEAIACGDLDNDGWDDVAAVGPDAPVLQILRSAGAGNFLPAVSLPADVAPQRVLLGWLDANADLDVVVVCKGLGQTPTSGRVLAWINDGTGKLTAGATVVGGRTVTDGLLHDIDNDGDLDVVVVDNGKSYGTQLQQLLLIENDGAGGLSLGTTVAVGAPARFAALADATGDGVADLLLTPVGSSAVLYPARYDGSLALGQVCDLPHAPRHFATGDLDGDGWLDVFYSAPLVAATLLGSPDGLLPTPIPSPALGAPTIPCLSLADMTGDGGLDALVVFGEDPGRVAVAPGLGDGTFGDPLSVDISPFTPSTPARIEAADLNGDGWLDAVELGHVLPSRLDVYLNSGASNPGQLHNGKNFPPGGHTQDVALADVDGDGVIDAALARGPVAAGLPCTLALMSGNGNGGLAAPVATDLPVTGIEPAFIALADVDLDGQLDAAVALDDGTLVLATGDGSGGWSPGPLLQPPTMINNGGGLAVADVDGDGWPDVVQASAYLDDELAVRRGDGAGGLLAPDFHSGFGDASEMKAADMNRDGRPDVLTIDGYAQDAVHGHVRILENTRRTFTWTDLGHAKAGSHGAPHLTGTGALTPGSAGELLLGQAAPGALAALFVSEVEQPQPWKGGTLVPAPQLLIFVVTDTQGRVLMPWAAWPVGPSGATLVVQYAIADPGAPQGTTLSNALRGTLPD